MREITNGRRRKRGKGFFIGILAGILLLGALVVFGLFRVQEVEVTGNERFTAQQIQNAVMQDGLCQNTLYLLWKFRDKEKAAAALPFLNDMEAVMVSPFKVRLKVYEKPEIGYFQNDGKYVYFDGEGMVMELTDTVHEGVPFLTGLSVSKANLYETLELTEEGRLNTVLTLTKALNQNRLVPEEIRFSTTDEIILIFGKTKALLGKDENLEDKVAALAAIYPKVEGQEGNLHMQNYSLAAQTVTFRKGADEEELDAQLQGETAGQDAQTGAVDQEGETKAAGETGTAGEVQAETETQLQEAAGPTYQESDGTFATDASGNEYYTDAAGNITYDCQQYNYTNADGSIITDGYGYIDPYTGAYII